MKKLFVIFVIAMLAFALNAKTEAPIQEKSPIHTTVNATDDLWDVLLQFDIDTPTGQVGLAGMEWDGTYFYATKWSASNQVFQFDDAGNYIAPITVPLTGCRDIAYDGTYFYGSPASASVTCWEPTTGAAVAANNINVAGALVRAIAYDEVTDSFYSGNWSDNIVNWNRSGTILGTNPWAGSMYGMAFDNDPAGPYLYAHSQDTGCVAYQLDVNNAMAQVAVMDYTGIGGTGAIAGGACVMNDWDPAFVTLGLLLQGTPDYIVVVELRAGADPDTPGAPTDVAVIPDAGGALEALVTWVCPSVTAGGAALTSLDEMRVYRDGALIYTDTNPSIGGPGTYNDAAVPASGVYNYTVVGYNAIGEGLPVAYSTWIGEDVPACVSNLMLEGMNGNGYLTWTNPTTGLNGGAFNNPIVGYHITRLPGNTVFELAGIATSYTDTTIPGADYYSYTVVPYNVIGDGGSATSNTSMIGAGDEIFMDDFENGLGNWTVTTNGQPGSWMIYGAGAFPNVYTLPPTSTGSVCAADADETYPVDSELILTNALDLSTYETANIQFDNDWQAIAVGDYAYVDVSVDGGANWTNVLTFDDVDVRMTHEIVDITAVAAGQSNVTIRFYSVQPGWDWWWAIDNVGVYGAGGGITLDPPSNLAVETNTNENFATFTWDSPAGGGGEIEELIYDNGTSTGAYSYVGYSMGTQMSPSSPCQILELKIHTSDGTDFNAEVWGWAAGAPTEDLLHQESATAVLDDWVVVDVSDENLMVAGDFVVAFGSLNAVTYMSYDAGLNNGRSWDHDDTGGWASWSEAYLCRAVVQYGDGTVAELSPTVNPVGTHSSVRGEKISIDVVDHSVDSSRELQSFNVYLNGVMQGNTDDTEWIFTDLTNGTTYTAAVEAVYDEGVSALVQISFEYMGLGAGNNIIGSSALIGNYPNPFNPETNIAYSVKETGKVTLEVYNLRGQLVRTLVNGINESGDHIVNWNGTNDAGKTVASGVYFYKMKAPNFESTKKMILMK